MTDPLAPEALLAEWYRRVLKSQHAHYGAATHFARLNYWLGIPVVVLAAVVGTAVFATLQQQVGLGLKVLVGLINILVAVLGSLQTFLRFAERAEKHRLVGAKYGAIRRELEAVRAVLPESPAALGQVLERVRERLDALATEAPEIPPAVWVATEAWYRARSMDEASDHG